MPLGVPPEEASSPAQDRASASCSTSRKRMEEKPRPIKYIFVFVFKEKGEAELSACFLPVGQGWALGRRQRSSRDVTRAPRLGVSPDQEC